MSGIHFREHGGHGEKYLITDGSRKGAKSLDVCIPGAPGSQSGADFASPLYLLFFSVSSVLSVVNLNQGGLESQDFTSIRSSRRSTILTRRSLSGPMRISSFWPADSFSRSGSANW